MIENKDRIGNFTSSQIHKLLKEGRKKGTWGAPALTYIDEKRIERRMKRSLDTGAYSQDMAWGKFMELVVFGKLGTDYLLTSKATDVHPEIPFWAGSKDFHKNRGNKMYCIGDIKCYQPKKFAKYTDALLKQDVIYLKSTFPEEYWQLISNAIINGVEYAEAVTYMPYESEMEEIRELAYNYGGDQQWQYRFIYEKPTSELAVLPNDGYYKNINTFQFKLPEEDVKLLTAKVLAAGKLLTAE